MILREALAIAKKSEDLPQGYYLMPGEKALIILYKWYKESLVRMEKMRERIIEQETKK